jgi:hypothetical protein
LPKNSMRSVIFSNNGPDIDAQIVIFYQANIPWRSYAATKSPVQRETTP